MFGTRIKKTIPFWGTNTGRLLYAGSIAIPLSLFTGSWVIGGINLATIFLGQAILGFSPWQWMQQRDDMFRMSLRGVIGIGLSAITAAYFLSVPASLILLVTGLLMGPIYYVSVHKLPLFPFLSDTEIKDKNDTAEVLYGFVTGLGFVVSVLI
jgi:hypothetical protein